MKLEWGCDNLRVFSAGSMVCSSLEMIGGASINPSSLLRCAW